MEFRQFKRYAEERMSHDQEEIAELEELLFKRDLAIQSLTSEIQAYKHRLVNFGFGPIISEPHTPNALNAAAAAFDYPPLRCKIPDNNEETSTDLDKYAFGETPRDQIQNLEQRITQMEIQEKGVVGFSPQKPQHARKLSTESPVSSLFPVKDDISDRVYTVDRVHYCGPESYISPPREIDIKEEKVEKEEEEIKILNLRLQALEADRETMRQTMLTMGKDKAQLILLREIAQQLCKEVTPQAQQNTNNKMVKKHSFIRSFSIVTAIKWITSFLFWRRRVSRTKYTFGITNNNAGLLLLLDKKPRLRRRQSLSRTLR
ncbi:uncharacterized protein A4U43_C01F33800 [Asparagus officinalis]|uniref:GTD-binding domain-containing protein n=1 Tax=Asparagus officinalis TaxID=4686 RepID=A0A5P1FWV9_ASPOF|nr:myosin-binding protein 7-like [Asparagus officinalis]ONK81879.1 uncharacterized protein A4U43_C01F33800 [Asparagus officinalis]